MSRHPKLSLSRGQDGNWLFTLDHTQVLQPSVMCQSVSLSPPSYLLSFQVKDSKSEDNFHSRIKLK